MLTLQERVLVYKSWVGSMMNSVTPVCWMSPAAVYCQVCFYHLSILLWWGIVQVGCPTSWLVKWTLCLLWQMVCPRKWSWFELTSISYFRYHGLFQVNPSSGKKIGNGLSGRSILYFCGLAQEWQDYSIFIALAMKILHFFSTLSVISLWPTDVSWRHGIGSTLAQAITRCHFSTKLSPESMFTYNIDCWFVAGASIGAWKRLGEGTSQTGRAA